MNLTLRKYQRLSRTSKKETLSFFLYLSPWLIGFTLFTIVPMIVSFIFSFQKMSVLDLESNTSTWVGLLNYQLIFGDQFFLASIKNTFFYAIVKTFVSLFIALLVALLINTKFFGNKVARIFIYLPAIIPSVIITPYIYIFKPNTVK